MVAGLRLSVRIHSITNSEDDDIGGAMITGTSSAIPAIPASITYMKPSKLLLEQGMTIQRLCTIVVQPGRLGIYEDDEVEVVGPAGHEDFGNKFGVISVGRTGLSPNDGRGRFLALTCKRLERGRGTQAGYQ